MTMRSSLGFTEGMVVGMTKSRPERGKFKVFDWTRAANLIKFHQPKRAEAGLAQDWGLTCAVIWRNGEPVKENDGQMYLESFWATPIIVFEDGKEVECWVHADDIPAGEEWDASTMWPQSSLAIVGQV